MGALQAGHWPLIFLEGKYHFALNPPKPLPPGALWKVGGSVLPPAGQLPAKHVVSSRGDCKRDFQGTVDEAKSLTSTRATWSGLNILHLMLQI